MFAWDGTMKFRALIPLLVALGSFAFAAFESPNKEARTAAVGSLVSLDPKLRRVFSDTGEFQAKKEPAFNDWLTLHQEDGQTFNQYISSRPNLPNGRRRKLYILPIGNFEKGIAPDLDLLREYTAAYYHPLEVGMLPVIGDKEVPATERINRISAKKQWKSTDILDWLKAKLPADGYAMIAVTMTDLYPEEAWNFVFGQASLRERTGVFSFARYHPSWDGGEADEGTRNLVLRRAAKILTHEMGHMFGIRHCVHYECNMNGANHLEEADSTPMELCPVCLRKLYHAVRFDPLERYGLLDRFHAKHGMEAESKWIKERVAAIEAAK
ncbi:archaemetzincin [Luteolibacter sp. GHJ8]|uniref:Archaemetzincin n=1 Tax=Luteolibacter rhizosphaerae TaxID=2989719 RepID=A0ABT3G593_9BACT|nr:archaemetzincin [Luteolibacter rhizosphaerae]MCW1915008.1 archaemetzincin [Luteolibacter rhizosphaerae]